MEGHFAQQVGSSSLINLKSLLILVTIFFAFDAFAQEKIGKPGFIPAGVMVCDELDCRFLSESYETAAKIMSYEPSVGVHVVFNGKSYVVPGEEVFIQNNGCKLPLKAFLAKNFACEAGMSSQDGAIQNELGGDASSRSLPEHGQMFADPLQRTLGEKSNSLR